MTLPAAPRPATLRSCFTAAMLLASALPAAGADWLFPGFDEYYDIGANWSTGTPPGAGDAANFLGSNFGVIVWDDATGSRTSASVLVDQASVIFSNAPGSTSDHTHTTVGDFVVSNGGIATAGGGIPAEPMFLIVGGNLDLRDNSAFHARFASEVSAGNLFVGDTSGQSASATIDGAGTMLSVSGITSLGFSGATGTLSFTNGADGNLLGQVNVGDSAVAGTAGVINVTGGSVVTTGTMFVGGFVGAGTSGTVLVDGPGSRVTQSGASTFSLGAGSLSTGVLTVSNSGVFQAGTGPATIHATGSLDLDTGGMFIGRDVQIAGTATLNGGLLFADHLQLNGGTVNTNSNAVVSVNTMSGFGSNTTLNGFVTFGEPAGAASASHTVGGGQTFDVGRTLVVGLNRQATFAVNGGDVTAGGLRIADQTAANGSLVDVTTNGTLAVNGDADIGSAAGGVGTLITSVGGWAEIGGTLRVFSTGLVNVGDTAALRANTLDTTGGGAFSAVAGSTVGFNNLTGFGNTINFAGSVRTGVDAGADGGFHAVTAGQTFTVGGNMKVGTDSGATPAQFNVDGGTLTVGDFLDIASAFAGDGRDATFRVLNGGTATNAGTAASDYGSAGGAAATIFVDGAGSRWDVQSAFLNRGTMTLSNGGTYAADGFLSVRTDGVVNINAGGTLDLDGGLFVVGGTLTRAHDGTLDLGSSNTLTASADALVVSQGGTLNINNGNSFVIQDGADFRIEDTDLGGGGTAFGLLKIGESSFGSLTIEGAGSRIDYLTSTSNRILVGLNAGGTMTVRDGAVADLHGRQIELGRAFGADADGTLDIRSGASVSVGSARVATFSVGGHTPTGRVDVDGAGSSLTVTGTDGFVLGHTAMGFAVLNLTNGGTLDTGTGTLSVRGTGQVNLNTGATLRAATIDHTHGGTFNFGDGNLSVQSFNGNLLNTGGTLAPGGTPGDTDTIGTTTINGNYTQQAGSTLALGTRTNATHDRLVVTGHLELDGALALTDDEGFSFAVGQHYDLLDWGTLGGAFDSVALFDISAFNGLGWNTEDLYNTGEVSFEHEGDLNTDGFVGVEDLDIILANWNATTWGYNYALGDVSGDGFVDGIDLQLVIDHFGNGTPPGGNVPEPGSLTLLGLGVLALVRRRRRA